MLADPCKSDLINLIKEDLEEVAMTLSSEVDIKGLSDIKQGYNKGIDKVRTHKSPLVDV